MFALATREQANAVTKNNRDNRDCDIVNQTGSKKLTDYVAAIDVHVPGIGESIRKSSCRARIEVLGVERLHRMMGHHNDSLANVGPLFISEDSFIGPLANYDRIHARH